jgi:hypothetical protein
MSVSFRLWQYSVLVDGMSSLHLGSEQATLRAGEPANLGPNSAGPGIIPFEARAGIGQKFGILGPKPRS